MNKKRSKKGTAVLLTLAMILGIMPAVSTPLEVRADGNTLPSVTQFATKEQLMSSFDLEDSTTEKTVKKVVFGQNGSGAAQEWLIAGKDPDTTKGDNIVLFAASSLMKTSFDSSRLEKEYDSGWGVYL